MGAAYIGQGGRGYLQAAANTKVIGHQICLVVKAIKQARPKMKFHLIGFSLGAHASGFAGKECRNAENNSPIIGKITGNYICPLVRCTQSN